MFQLLWFFLGGFGAHRFYLGRTKSGLGMLALLGLSFVLTVILIGFLGYLALGIWWLADAFLIPGLAATENSRLISQLNG